MTPTFMISKPYVSNGLKLTYNKDFTIVETKRDGTRVAHTFHPKTNKWKETGNIPTKYQDKNGTSVNIADVVSGNIGWSRNYLVFTTKKEAYLAKAYLIEEMRKEYNAAINDLRRKLERNVPDLSNITDSLRDEYPEYFI